MLDPRVTIRDAAGDALIVQLTADGYTTDTANRVVTNPDIDTPRPYIQLNQMSYQPWSTRTHEGANCRLTMVAVAETLTEAMTVAASIVSKLGRNLLTLDSPHETKMAWPEFTDEDANLEWRVGEIDYYGVVVRMRYHTMETG